MIAKSQKKLLTEIGFEKYASPVALFSDSQGAIAMNYNPVKRDASKHIDLADHYAREQVELGTISITHVSTKIIDDRRHLDKGAPSCLIRQLRAFSCALSCLPLIEVKLLPSRRKSPGIKEIKLAKSWGRVKVSKYFRLCLLYFFICFNLYA